MKTLLAAIMIVAIAGSAFAGIRTTKPMGPLDLVIDAAGNGTMINNGAAPFMFDGYTIVSDLGTLGAVFGINDNAWALGAPFATMLGLTMQTATLFQPLTATPFNYSEITLNVGATLQPGAQINLGQAFVGLTQANGIFTYVDSTASGDTSWEGAIIPEPATMSLLGLGALALVRRRR